jgi:hypothetical protein
MKFIPHCRGQTRIGKIDMKLQNLIHIVIGIVCIPQRAPQERGTGSDHCEPAKAN